MNAIYAETSAILAWLLGEDDASVALAVINDADQVFTSVLTELEVRRVLVRAAATGILTEAAAIHLHGVFETARRAWSAMEITDTVRMRASIRYPIEPIRSLDAIHLATALEFTKAVDTLSVLSFDARVVNNLEPLGLHAAVPA